MPGPLRAHAGQGRPGHVQQPENVGREHCFGFRGGGFLDRTDQAPAGVVDQEVDAAGPGGRRANLRGCLLLVGDIQRDRQQTVSGFGNISERVLHLGQGRPVATTSAPAVGARAAIWYPRARAAPVRTTWP